MKIQNTNNLSIEQIVEKLSQAGFEMIRDKNSKKSYYYIVGKNRFMVSRLGKWINVGILPKKLITLIVVIFLFAIGTGLYTWFFLYFLSKLTIFIGAMVGALIYVIIYRVINKQAYNLEKNKINEIFNNK